MAVSILLQDLRTLLRKVNAQIAVVEKHAEDQKIDPPKMQTMNGAFVMIPLLVAKSNILLALSNLETK